MTFIIPITVVILAAIFTYVLYWISYPFLLRFFIENNIRGGAVSNLQNGSNGNNGIPGDNSPQTRNGAAGPAGVSTPAGRNGADGRLGAPGLDGPPGIDGEPGEDGEDGSTGVPGADPIFIREDIFNPDSKRVFYVNGVPINEHAKTLEKKKDSAFSKDVERIKQRIQTSFKNQSDKTFFTNLANSLTKGTTPNANQYILDTPLKFNNFLDALNIEYKNARNALAIAKEAQTTFIETSQSELESLRSKRTMDYNSLQLAPFVNTIRDIKLNDIVSPSPRFTNLRDDIISNTITIDQAIANLVSIRTTALNTAETATTQAIKDAQAVIISETTAEINLLKHVKELISEEKEAAKNLIFNAYKNGVDLSSSPYTGTTTIFFSDYSPNGSILLNSQIATARDAINVAVAICGSTLDTFILPYKIANP